MKVILFILMFMVNNVMMKGFSQNIDLEENNQKPDSTTLIVNKPLFPFHRYCVFGALTGRGKPTLGIRYNILKKPVISCGFFYEYLKDYAYNGILVGENYEHYFVFSYQPSYSRVSFFASMVVLLILENEFKTNSFTYRTSFIPTVGVNFIILKRFNITLGLGIGVRSGTGGWSRSFIPNWITSHADISFGYNFNLRKKHENR